MGDEDRPGDADRAGVRRLDWRFLLPQPALGSVHLDGAADDELRLALEQASTVDRPGHGSSTGGDEPVDVAVLIEPTAEQVRRAVGRVRPGGSLYLELASPRRRLRRGPAGRRLGPRAAARLLRAHGGSDIVERWHWPSHRNALELVPLDDRAALEVSLGRRRSRFGKLAASLLRRVGTARWLPDALPSVSLVAHRPTTPAGDLVAGTTTPTDLACATLLALSGPDPERAPHGLRAVVLTPRHRASRHVVFLVLDAGGDVRWVAKAPRDPADHDALDREARILEQLRVEPSTSAVAPRLVAAPGSSGWPLLIETAVRGRTLDRAAIHADPEGWAGRATALVEVLARTASAAPAAGDAPGEVDRGRRSPDDRFERLVAGPLNALRDGAASGGDPLGLGDLVPRTLSRLAARPWADLPPVLEHGDLAPPNLLVTEAGALAAIDWELAEPIGLPGHDLALFLAFAAAARASSKGMRDIEAAGRVVAAAFERPEAWAARRLRAHLGWLGVDPAWAPDLALVAFARVTASMPARAGRPPGAWLARDRHLAYWRHLARDSR